VQDGSRIKLKRKEAEILLYLINRKNEIVSSDELIENLWDSDKIPAYATIRTYIKNLRRAIGGERIENIKGSGYRLNIL